jgi:hypothetical protein
MNISEEELDNAIDRFCDQFDDNMKAMVEITRDSKDEPVKCLMKSWCLGFVRGEQASAKRYQERVKISDNYNPEVQS